MQTLWFLWIGIQRSLSDKTVKLMNIMSTRNLVSKTVTHNYRLKKKNNDQNFKMVISEDSERMLLKEIIPNYPLDKLLSKHLSFSLNRSYR